MSATGALEVRDLRPEDVPAAIDVCARGMRDNPVHVAAYGDDPQRRLDCHRRAVRALFATFPRPAICAVRDGELLGVAAFADPGNCQPSPSQSVRLLPQIAAMGPRAGARVARWLAAWGRRDPTEEHVHLGPVAVDAHLQGQGIGLRLMREHAARLDAAGLRGYLETDKRENVRFYERVGYTVVDEGSVLGVPNWFMHRDPA
jgi:ribosomal protein S18 acetylase RimI-like enzyme